MTRPAVFGACDVDYEGEEAGDYRVIQPGSFGYRGRPRCRSALLDGPALTICGDHLQESCPRTTPAARGLADDGSEALGSAQIFAVVQSQELPRSDRGRLGNPQVNRLPASDSPRPAPSPCSGSVSIFGTLSPRLKVRPCRGLLRGPIPLQDRPGLTGLQPLSGPGRGSTVPRPFVSHRTRPDAGPPVRWSSCQSRLSRRGSP